MKIRPFTIQDIPAVLNLQGRNPLAAQWRQDDYAALAADRTAMVLVAEFWANDSTSELAGFAVLARAADEAEVRNLAVTPERQRKGIGRSLLAESHRRLARAGVLRIYLEVRPSNRGAVAFYRALGYRSCGLRKDYYCDPPEDALVFCLKLAP